MQNNQVQHGDVKTVQAVAFEQGLDKEGNKADRKHLIFWIPGTERTIEQVFMERGTNPVQQKQIWYESLKRQLGEDATVDEIPDLKKLIYVDKMSKKDAEKKIADAQKKLIPKFDKFFERIAEENQEFKLYMSINHAQNGLTYYNWVPYEVRTNSEQEPTEAKNSQVNFSK